MTRRVPVWTKLLERAAGHRPTGKKTRGQVPSGLFSHEPEFALANQNKMVI